VTSGARRSALVVVAAEADPVVGEWRERYQPAAVARRLPPHLTILFPFVPVADLDDAVMSRLGAMYAPLRPFAYELASGESFPDAAWLAPVPAAPFRELVEVTRLAFPGLAPYGDPEHVVVPHCTVGTADDPKRVDGMVRTLRERLGPRLPIRCRADEVVLLAEEGDGTWARRGAFPLRGE
jgi:2'-5' RNA ligase